MMPDIKIDFVHAEAILRKILDRLWFTAKYGDAEWAASVLLYIEECADEVEVSGEQAD
jgi:hypothetical protein